MSDKYSKRFISDGYYFRDRKALNATCKLIYHTHPIVNSIIDSHSEIPLNYLSIKFPDDPKIASFFEDQINKIHLLMKLKYIIQEYWLFGESFVYSEIDDKNKVWADLIIQNPDYVIVKKTITGGFKYYLRPDENLRRIVLSNKEDDKKAAKQLSPTIVDCIKKGDNILLDNFYISHIIRQTSPYEIRGMSLLTPILKTICEEAENMNTSAEQIRICLMDPFNNENINIERIKSNYKILFSQLEDWAKNKIFLPIAKINSFDEIPKLKFDLDALITGITK